MEYVIIQKGRYLQDIGNAYTYKFQCLQCLTLSSRLINKQAIDKELEDKEVYEIKDECKTCKRSLKIEFTKVVKFKIKEV